MTILASGFPVCRFCERRIPKNGPTAWLQRRIPDGWLYGPAAELAAGDTIMWDGAERAVTGRRVLRYGDSSLNPFTGQKHRTRLLFDFDGLDVQMWHTDMVLRRPGG